MSKRISKLLDFMKLNDNEYEDVIDEFEEAEEEDTPVKIKSRNKPKPAKQPKPARKPFTKPKYEEPDDDDEFEEPAARRTFGSSKPRKNNSKIVKMNSSVYDNAMEVCVSRPVDFVACREISDIILDNKAAIINFEAVTAEEAQRIIDFVSGSCYAIKGNVKMVSDNIVVVTPSDIDISGDFGDSNEDVNIPSLDELDMDY